MEISNGFCVGTADAIPIICAALTTLVVGECSVAAHGRPRVKDDFYFELWVEPTLANAGRVVAALTEFGYSAYSDHVQEFATLDRMTHVGNPPFRIDAMTTISGVPSFRAAWRRRVAASVGGLDVAFLGRADFGERQAIQGQLEI